MSWSWEAVPNFTGADPAFVSEIATEAAGLLLDSQSDPRHGRTVISLASPSLEDLALSLFRLAVLALSRVDVRRQKGVHPRVGVADVIPLVPLGASPMEEAVAAARRLGQRLHSELGLPVYFYAQASYREPRVTLADVRHGRVEPDLGRPGDLPAGGACCVGARRPLVAYNITAPEMQPDLGREVVREVRRLRGVQALLFGHQVSMNLTEPEAVGMREAYERVRELVSGPLFEELVGLAPACAATTRASDGALLEGRLARLAARNAIETSGPSSPALSSHISEVSERLALTAHGLAAKHAARADLRRLRSLLEELGAPASSWEGHLAAADMGIAAALGEAS